MSRPARAPDERLGALMQQLAQSVQEVARHAQHSAVAAQCSERITQSGHQDVHATRGQLAALEAGVRARLGLPDSND